VEKKLVTVGNSVALVLDKSLRHALGIKPTTLVRVMTDGTRIIIEPSGERTPEAKRTNEITGRMRAIAIVRDLLERYGFANELFAQLSCGWPGRHPRFRANVYRFWLEDVAWDQLSEAELRVMRRFEVLHAELRTGERSWAEGIAAALAAEPFDPNDPAEQSVGVASATA